MEPQWVCRRNDATDSQKLKYCKQTGLCQIDCSDTKAIGFWQYPFGVSFLKKNLKCEEPQDAIVRVDPRRNFWDQFTVTQILSDDDDNDKATVAFGIHNESKQKVVLKAFVHVVGREYYIENFLYEIDVLQELLKLNASVPHFAKFVAAYTYKSKDVPAGDKLFKKVLKFGTTKRKNVHGYYISVTNHIEGPTIETYLKQARRSTLELKSILFQILFCVFALNSTGCQHNDMHWQNVIITPNPKCDTAIYYIGNQAFKVPILSKVNIIDFDLSVCSQCGKNTSLESEATPLYNYKDNIVSTHTTTWTPPLPIENRCNGDGYCNQRNAKFDMFTILSYILKLPIDQTIKDVIKFALGPVPIPHIHPEIMCDVKTGTYQGTTIFHAINETLNETKTREYCVPFVGNNPETVKTPIEVILTQFEEFKITQTAVAAKSASPAAKKRKRKSASPTAAAKKRKSALPAAAAKPVAAVGKRKSAPRKSVAVGKRKSAAAAGKRKSVAAGKQKSTSPPKGNLEKRARR